MSLKNSDLLAIDQYFARKQYDRAVELLERLHQEAPEEISLRMKLADAYFLYGRTSRAIAILEELAEDYARRGFITKAMAIQKKIKRINPKAKIDIYRFAQDGAVGGTTTPARSEADSTFHILDGIFSGLARAEFDDVYGQLSERTAERDEVILKEGESTDSLYIIVNGQVRVVTLHKGREVELARLEAGDFFGEVALLTGKKRTASIVAEKRCGFLVMDRKDFEVLADKYPQLRHTLETALERRASATVERLLALEEEEQETS